MSRNLLGFCVATCAALFGCATLPAQQPNYNQPGPVPSAILNAKTIFVSNAGADSGLFPEPFSGNPDRAYSELYSSLKTSGKYALANDPSEADLVLEVQLSAPNGPTKGSKVNGASDPVPMLRLVVYDRKTHYVLWAITESIEIAFRQKTHDRNFDDAIAALVGEFERISGKLPAAANP